MSRFSKKVQPLRKAIIICIIVVATLSLSTRYFTSNTIIMSDLNKLPVITTINVKNSTKNESNHEEVKTSPVNLDYVIVHLDLKGMPPKLSYLKSLLATLKRNGVNGLLMEYEDMFPYEGTLANLSVAHHYKKDELKTFLQIAAISGLEIIPLVQTFGQMEYVLKHEEFQHLREKPTYPDTICPSQKGSFELIKEILTQVLGFHQSIAPLKHVHIGGNKISVLNECAFCTKRKLSHAELFMNHVVKVADMVKNIAPESTSLVWWDMIQSMSNSISNYTVRYENIDVVYWCYTPKVNIPLDLLYNVNKNFANTWIASAYKGVDAPNSNLPNIVHRALNTLSWMKKVLDYNSNKTNKGHHLKGIFLAGLSHRGPFEPICNLLVPSIPCLLIDLTIVNQFKNKLINKNIDYSRLMNDVANYIKIILHCDHNIDFTNDLTFCKFEGHELYTVMYNYDEILKRINHDVHELNNYIKVRPYVKMGNSGTIKLQDLQVWCKTIDAEISNFTDAFKSSMAPYYEKTVIEEYINNKSLEADMVIHVCDTSYW